MKGLINFISNIILVVAPIVIGICIDVRIGIIVFLLLLAYIINKHMPTINFWKGRFYYLKDNEKAFKSFEKAYKTGRMSADNKIDYGYFCMREGKYDKAERLFNDALAFQKDEGVKSRAKTNFAILLWKKGDINSAVEMIAEVYEGYKSSVVYGNYGYLLILNNELEKALEVNLEGYDYDSTNDVICDNLVQNYYMLGNYEESIKYAEEIMEREPASPVPYYNYAKTLIAVGNKEKAGELLKKALQYSFSNLAGITKEDVEQLLLSLDN